MREDSTASCVVSPLKNLEVEDGGNVFHRGTGEHFAGKVEHDHSRWEALCHSAEERFGLWLVQTILQVVDEWGAVDSALIIKRQAEVLGERALT